jgi:hypothetical protein
MWFGFGVFAGTSVAIAEQPEPEPPMILVPPSNEAMPFEVVDHTITYEHTDDLGMPCYYHMRGTVHDIQGEAFTDFVVNIMMLDLAPPVGYAWPGENAFIEDGSSGWGTMLPQAPVPYLVWLTVDRGGRRISPIIWVPSLGCDDNTAVINFVQVRLHTSEGFEHSDTFEVDLRLFRLPMKCYRLWC